MKIKDWMNMGYGIKRWFGLGIVGLSVIIFALIELMFQRFGGRAYNYYYIYLMILGVSVLYVSIAELIKSFMTLAKDGLIDFNMDSREIGSLIHEKKLLVQGPKVVILGGGTGLSTILKGLKNYTNNITAVVTVADDGGGSGVLREDLGILPPGDIRNCLVALANTEPLMEELMQYRFKDGSLKGQSFGNLFLAAMNGVSDNFEDAVQKMANVLAITGKVLPVTLDNIKINAILDNGQLVVGESHIPDVSISEGAKIRKLYVTPENAQCLPDVREDIECRCHHTGTGFTLHLDHPEPHHQGCTRGHKGKQSEQNLHLQRHDPARRDRWLQGVRSYQSHLRTWRHRKNRLCICQHHVYPK